MTDSTRRQFFQQSVRGLAAAGTVLILREDAGATPAITDEHEANQVLVQMSAVPTNDLTPNKTLAPVTPQPYGPFYKAGAPFRAKLCLPGEPGSTFILTGRVWALDSRRPLPGTVLDFWHVDMQEKYSNGVSDFRNRGRLITSETGAYELESIRPIPYRPNPNDSSFWRCAHFHLLAVAPGYKPLVTEIHFQNDPHMNDPMFRIENAMAIEKRTMNGVSVESGVFDIVLERETAAK